MVKSKMIFIDGRHIKLARLVFFFCFLTIEACLPLPIKTVKMLCRHILLPVNGQKLRRAPRGGRTPSAERTGRLSGLRRKKTNSPLAVFRPCSVSWSTPVSCRVDNCRRSSFFCFRFKIRTPSIRNIVGAGTRSIRHGAGSSGYWHPPADREEGVEDSQHQQEILKARTKSGSPASMMPTSRGSHNHNLGFAFRLSGQIKIGNASKL